MPVSALKPGKCKACGSPDIRTFLDLGPVPPVNAFLKADQAASEKAYRLEMVLCDGCFLAQLRDVVDPDELFRNYLHISSASAANIRHLEEVAALVKSRFKVGESTRILEIGSNDGTLLAMFRDRTGRLLGVDPAENLVEISRLSGVETIPDFLYERTARRIRDERGEYDIILALNIVPHTPDVVELLRGVRHVMAPTGTFIMEGVYVLETITRGEFDTIYHEHVYCFSLHSLISTFARAGLAVVDAEKIPTQGGSLRVYAQKTDYGPEISPRVALMLREEKEKGLIDTRAFANVGGKVLSFRRELLEKIDGLREKHGKLVGLGAPARGVVIMNYCGIGADRLKYIVDDTSLKQGRLSPGTHVQVEPWDKLKTDPAAAFLLLSWNYEKDMLEKLRRFVPKASVIVPFPDLKVIEFVP